MLDSHQRRLDLISTRCVSNDGLIEKIEGGWKILHGEHCDDNDSDDLL